MKYNFYYDETEHSRKITFNTVEAKNFYDEFIAGIVGWSENSEKNIFEKYENFKNKYNHRMSSGEFKSRTFKQNQFNNGFASLNKENTNMISDFLSIFDEDLYFYFFVASKLEYVIRQLFSTAENGAYFNVDAMVYSITKAINIYKPDDVIKSIYENNPKEFIRKLKAFLKERIEINRQNTELKSQENTIFNDIISTLEFVVSPKEYKWDYRPCFCGFDLYLSENNIKDYCLIIDKEGEEYKGNNTISAAKDFNFRCRELNSKDCIGIQIADMLIGIMAKVIKSLSIALHQDSCERIEKKILTKDWFIMSQEQMDIYKKLYKIIFQSHNSWHKTYSGIYADNFIAFLSLIEYINKFKTVDDLKSECKSCPEDFNSFVIWRLNERTLRFENHLPVKQISNYNTEYFINDRGAKVYFDQNKQPILKLHNGKNIYDVLSVGFTKNEQALITIKEDGDISRCYRLPKQAYKWALACVISANEGQGLFPAKVVFTKYQQEFYINIL